MKFSVNTPLKKTIYEIMLSGRSTAFTMTARFTSEQDTTYSYTPMQLEGVSIEQKPSDMYCDRIILQFNASPAEYIRLYENRNGLMVTLTQTPVEETAGAKKPTAPNTSRLYYATFVNPKSIREEFRDSQMNINPDYPVTMVLVEKEIYLARRVKMNTLFKNTTVHGALCAIAAAFGITKTYIVPPDNPKVYPLIKIPPSMGIDTVFDYIHHEYGVYMKGFEYFFTGGCLYIYPPFETTPKFNETAILYRARYGEYAGSLAYHRTRDGVTEIVLTDKSASKDISQVSADNIGQATMFLRASQLVDGFITSTNSGIKLNTNSSAVTLKNRLAEKVGSSLSMLSNYAKATDNVCKVASSMAKANARIIASTWNMATPFILKPGHAIKYTYDQDRTMVTDNGILESVQYNLVRGQRGASGPVFTCSANLQIRLEPKVYGEEGA